MQPPYMHLCSSLLMILLCRNYTSAPLIHTHTYLLTDLSRLSVSCTEYYKTLYQPLTMAFRIATRRFLSPLSQAQFQRPSFIRTMATSGVRRPYEFLLIIPDKPGPEARKRRLAVRAYVPIPSAMEVRWSTKCNSPYIANTLQI